MQHHISISSRFRRKQSANKYINISKDIIFLSPGFTEKDTKRRTHNRGKLWDRYRSSQKIKLFIQKVVSRSSRPRVNHFAKLGTKLSRQPKKIKWLRSFLLFNLENSEEILQKCVDCFDYRRRKIESYQNNIEELLQDWSIISKLFGCELVYIQYIVTFYAT